MSINGMRSPAGAAPLPPHAASGDTGADTKRTPPGQGMHGAHQTVLSDRPPQRASESGTRPRKGLAKLDPVGLARAASAVPDAEQIASTVCADVENGKVALLASQSASALRAAASAASRGWMALTAEPLPRG